jgi:5'-3' exonuclease
MTKRLALVDLSGLYWRLWHAGKDQPLGFAFEQTLSGIQRFVEGFDCVAICCDAPPYWRKQLSEAYKAQRDKPEAQAIEQLRRVEARLDADGYCIWKCPGYEADDVIATATRIACDEGIEVVIGSSDKDMLQLVSDARGVSAVSVVQGVSYNEAAVQAKFEVPPSLMRDMLALWGDKSDNIPGVPSIGPKIAAKLLKDFGSVNGILASCDRIDNARIRALIFDHAEALRLSLKLVTLKDDAPINFGDCMQPRVAKPLTESRGFEEAEFDDVPSEPKQEEVSDVQASAEPQKDPEPEPPSAPDVKQPGPAPSKPDPKLDREAETTTAIVLRPPDWSSALEPCNVRDAYKMATVLYNSRLFAAYGNPDAVFAVILRGRSLGIDASTALSCFHIIEGKPVMHASLIVALVHRSGKAKYFQLLESSSTVAKYVTHREGDPRPVTMSFDVEDALAAGLLEMHQGKLRGVSKSGKPSNWDKYRRTMLRWRAATELARAVYPDVVTGLYTPDEVSDGQAIVTDGEMVA